MGFHRSQGRLAVLSLAMAGILLLGACTAPALVAPAQVAGLAQTGGTPSPVAPAPALAPGDSSRTITVVGEGKVTVAPTVATSSIGIEATAPTVAEAMTDARTRMAAVIQALKSAGVADKDIQTNNFSINLDTSQGGVKGAAVATTGAETTTVQGTYHVNNTVNVTIRNLDKVGAVIDAAVAAGANNVWGINFGLDDTSAAEAQARQKAVADAKARADSLAGLEGVKVGQVLSVSEVINAGSPKPMASAAFGMGGGGTPVETGTVDFTTQIQVVYAIQ